LEYVDGLKKFATHSLFQQSVGFGLDEWQETAIMKAVSLQKPTISHGQNPASAR